MKYKNLEGTELDCPFSKKEIEEKIKELLNMYIKKEHPSLFEIKMDYKINNKNGIDDKLNLKDAKIIEIINIELIDHKFYI